jgi:hypothetical protein
MSKIPNGDADLVEAAKQRAGGGAALARLYGVKRQAVNDWGRRRAIPRHVREQLRAYVADVSRPTRRLSREISSDAAIAAHQLATAVLDRAATAEETQYLLDKVIGFTTALIEKRRQQEAVP